MLSNWDIRLAFTAREFIIFKIHNNGKDFLIMPHGIIDMSKEIVQANIVNEVNGTYSYDVSQKIEVRVDDFKIIDIIDTVSKQKPSTISKIFQKFRALLNFNTANTMNLADISIILKEIDTILEEYRDHRDYRKSEVFRKSLNDLILNEKQVDSSNPNAVYEYYRDAVNTLSYQIIQLLSK